MLNLTNLNRTSLPRHARGNSFSKSRQIRLLRSVEQDAVTSVSNTVDRPQADEDAKMKATISTLDSLLVSQNVPQAATPSSRVAPSTKPSTNGSKPMAPAPPSGLNLPSLPLVDSSTSSSPHRKPAGLTFDQVMGFSGLAPEVINGRAAMIGFFIAINNELRTGESVFAQMVSGGAGQALIVIVAVTIASFAPAIRGIPMDEVLNKVPKNVKEWGPFTAAAEGLNGRLAMLGIGLLLFFEGAGSTAFFLN